MGRTGRTGRKSNFEPCPTCWTLKGRKLQEASIVPLRLWNLGLSLGSRAVCQCLKAGKVSHVDKSRIDPT